jgi:hypothetical protein
LKGLLLANCFVVQATDGYRIVFSPREIGPTPRTVGGARRPALQGTPSPEFFLDSLHQGRRGRVVQPPVFQRADDLASGPAGPKLFGHPGR